MRPSPILDEGAPPSDSALGPLPFKSDWAEGAPLGKVDAQLEEGGISEATLL